MLALVAGACHKDKGASTSSSPSPQVSAPPDRIENALAVFEHAALLKPASGDSESEASVYAPIIVHQIASTKADSQESSGGPRVAQLSADSNGVPVVFTAQSHAELFGETYPQWVFVWSYSKNGSEWRWMRITLDQEGYPQVLETLSPGWDHVEVYVSQHVESLAREQYGEPVPGCAYAVERPRTAGSPVRVVRVLNDGPVPMGPFVYLDTDLKFSTVLCRCMASQVREIVSNDYYQLVPITHALYAEPSADNLFLPPDVVGANPWLTGVADARFLAEVLRLPASF